MVSWGIVMTLMGIVKSYGGLLLCRLFLGGFESGLFPGATFYLSSWYKRRELSWRVSILFSAAALAGAFGGVLAYGISKLGGVGGQEGWRWIFYLEGIATVIAGVLAVFLLNDFPSDRPKFLTDSECKRVMARLQSDTGTGAGGLSPCIATCIAFLSGNTSPHTKRATALAFMISFGNTGGVISGQIYRTQDEPRFILGHAVNLGFCALGLINAVILLIGLRAENRRRDRLFGPTQSLTALVSMDSTSCGTDVKCSHISGLGSQGDKRRWGYENMSEQEICDLGDEHVAWRYIL
ncbi:unnamed protein product [Rotaria sp. Silwood1]|nr:unnamed protein product [Rotaria sp. Silwood1]CAF1613324.1 unnamed protein product [Rotaria sp. Silwood1]CAF3764902.1 unnamed protein product [Rotaria sp. Silwood1]CAF4890258.1 unnamed protein product [Rotaria sp. Silwood1]CAF5080855.1 unnamed protein product [Rotaria sp. Silwood1]